MAAPIDHLGIESRSTQSKKVEVWRIVQIIHTSTCSIRNEDQYRTVTPASAASVSTAWKRGVGVQSSRSASSFRNPTM